MTTGKALNGKPYAGNPHVAPSQCHVLRGCLSLSSLVAVFVGLACISAQAGAINPTENYWQTADNEWSGSWTNADHWSLGMIGEGQKARIPLGTGAFEIEFPRGAYTNAGELLLRGTGARFDITLNGTNTAYVMGGAANGSTDVHSGAPFVPTYGNYTFNSYTYGGPYRAAPLAFTNFKIRWASTDDQLLLDFIGGDYNFYNPEGSALTSPSINFFLMETDVFSVNRLVRFTDATVKSGSMNVGCGESSNRASSNLLLLDNTDMTLSSTLFFPLNSGGSSGWMSPTVSELKLDNASTLTVGTFSFSGTTKNGICSNKTFVVTLDN